jgi:hypothetical protein
VGPFEGPTLEKKARADLPADTRFCNFCWYLAARWAAVQ